MVEHKWPPTKRYVWPSQSYVPYNNKTSRRLWKDSRRECASNQCHTNFLNLHDIGDKLQNACLKFQFIFIFSTATILWSCARGGALILIKALAEINKIWEYRWITYFVFGESYLDWTRLRVIRAEHTIAKWSKGYECSRAKITQLKTFKLLSSSREGDWVAFYASIVRTSEYSPVTQG